MSETILQIFTRCGSIQHCEEPPPAFAGDTDAIGFKLGTSPPGREADFSYRRGLLFVKRAGGELYPFILSIPEKALET